MIDSRCKWFEPVDALNIAVMLRVSASLSFPCHALVHPSIHRKVENVANYYHMPACMVVANIHPAGGRSDSPRIRIDERLCRSQVLGL
jgi:hypothetical protein